MGICYGEVLGVKWFSKEDTMAFDVNINFSKKVRGERTEPNLKREEIPAKIPDILTVTGVTAAPVVN